MRNLMQQQVTSKQEKKSQYSNQPFTMIFEEELRYGDGISREPILRSILESLWFNNDEVYPSDKYLAERLKCSVRLVKYLLNKIEKTGFLIRNTVYRRNHLGQIRGHRIIILLDENGEIRPKNKRQRLGQSVAPLTYKPSLNTIRLNNNRLNGRRSGGNHATHDDVVHGLFMVSGEVIKRQDSEVVNQEPLRVDKDKPPKVEKKENNPKPCVIKNDDNKPNTPESPKKEKVKPPESKLFFDKQNNKIVISKDLEEKFSLKCSTWRAQIAIIETEFATGKRAVPSTEKGLLLFISKWLGKHKEEKVVYCKKTNSIEGLTPEVFVKLCEGTREEVVVKAVEEIKSWAIRKFQEPEKYNLLNAIRNKINELKISLVNKHEERNKKTIEFLKTKCNKVFYEHGLKVDIGPSVIYFYGTTTGGWKDNDRLDYTDKDLPPNKLNYELVKYLRKYRLDKDLVDSLVKHNDLPAKYREYEVDEVRHEAEGSFKIYGAKLPFK